MYVCMYLCVCMHLERERERVTTQDCQNLKRFNILYSLWLDQIHWQAKTEAIPNSGQQHYP
jgi:hypothetical protein